MAIDTVSVYNPKMKCPVYVKITTPRMNDYTVFDHYDIRVPDEENGDDGPYNYTHESILISKTVATWSEIPDMLKGYTAKSKDRDMIEQYIHPAGSDGSFDDDDELVVLIFLRIDKAKDFILSDAKVHTPQSISIEEIQDYES